jgi:hypothetical protein
MRHGVTSGNLSTASRRQIDDQVRLHAPHLSANDRRTIRDELARDAGHWLAADLGTGDPAGAVIDDLADEITDVFANAGGRNAIGNEHVLCAIFATLYTCRAGLERAAKQGVGRVAVYLGNELTTRLIPHDPATREFMNELTETLGGELGVRLVDLALGHVGLPTSAQLAELTVAFCPNLGAHPEACKIAKKQFGIAVDDAINDILGGKISAADPTSTAAAATPLVR